MKENTAQPNTNKKNKSIKRFKPRKLALLLAAMAATILGIGQLLLNYTGNNLNQAGMATLPANADAIQSFPIKVPTYEYGIAIDTFQKMEGTIKSGEFLADILMRYQVPYASIDQLVKNSEEIFNIRHIKAGKNYTILTTDSSSQADYFIYEPSIYEYVVFDLKRGNTVSKVEKPVTTKIQTASGKIESSLWNTMVDQGLSYELASKMEDALQWSVSFYHIQKDDEFKVVYEQNFVEDQPAGIGQVHAAYFRNMDKPFYAIYFDHEADRGFYDLEGRPMKKSFLKSPVKHSRISSFYNLNRFHPILKRNRPHYGTDYAAPHGTPIRAVGAGVVTHAAYTKGNGNYVKIKHRGNIETQYLHMSKFAKGIRSGAQVDQGDIIGYVGSTGLATGPHVCFRFWKNGKQINHLQLTFPPADPLPETELPAFMKLRDEYLTLMNIDLQSIQIAGIDQEDEPSVEEEGEEESLPATSLGKTGGQVTEQQDINGGKRD